MKKTSALSGINTSAACFSHCIYSLYMLQLNCDFYSTLLIFLVTSFFSLSIIQLLVKD